MLTENITIDTTIIPPQTTTTTKTTLKQEGLCSSNPCENDGICRLSLNKEFYTCWCHKNFTGKVVIY